MSDKKRALILGVGGQDGSYLADVLLEKGYEVHGLYRRSSLPNLSRIEHTKDRVTLWQGDITDYSSVIQCMLACRPQEVYNEADQDHVKWSQVIPNVAWEVTFKGVINVLEAVTEYQCRVPEEIKLFQPISATIFSTEHAPQNEMTSLAPASPYAIAKAAALHACRYYRDQFSVKVYTGIMYNHDSPRRGPEYLLHRICKAACEVGEKKREYLELYDLDAKVEIGFAKEYMDGAWAMMQTDKPSDYVMSSNVGKVTYSVHDLALLALRGVVANPEAYLKEKEGPRSRGAMLGNSFAARRAFGWDPQYTAGRMVHRLMTHYLEQRNGVQP